MENLELMIRGLYRKINHLDPITLPERFYSINDKITLDKGEYIVNKPIFIKKGGSLIIKPGTSLYFFENTGIICYSSLQAKGTQDEPINFLPYKERWGNISAKYGTELIFDYCKILSGMPFEYSFTDWGGGICAWDSKTFIIKNSLIHNCISNSRGGGIFTITRGSIIENNLFLNNRAKEGGGLYCEYSKSIINNVFEKNRAIFGGGIKNRFHKNLIFKNNKIVDNKGFVGGGIFDLGGSCSNENNRWVPDSQPNLIGNIVQNNCSKFFGGGIYCYCMERDHYRYIQFYPDELNNNQPDDIAYSYVENESTPYKQHTLISIKKSDKNRVVSIMPKFMSNTQQFCLETPLSVLEQL